MKYLKTIKDLFENINNNYKCVVCGEDLYITYDYGSKKTLQCSSDNAKFWNFPRGSKEQSESGIEKEYPEHMNILLNQLSIPLIIIFYQKVKHSKINFDFLFNLYN